MIEVLALASSVSKIAGGISTAIKAGRDINDLLPHFGKLGKIDSEIQLAESGKHKGPLGRLSSPEQEGLAIAQSKLKYDEAMRELESVCRLYGRPGTWDTVVREMGAARKRHADALKAQAAARDKLFWGISMTAGVLIFVAGCVFMFWGLDKAVNG